MDARAVRCPGDGNVSLQPVSWKHVCMGFVVVFFFYITKGAFRFSFCLRDALTSSRERVPAEQDKGSHRAPGQAPSARAWGAWARGTQLIQPPQCSPCYPGPKPASALHMQMWIAYGNCFEGMHPAPPGLVASLTRASAD